MPPFPAFFVQNNFVERLTVPVARFAHANGIALLDRSSTDDFDPDDCGVPWAEYVPVLPYGSVQFIRKLASSQLRPYVWHSETAFDARLWSATFPDHFLNAGGVPVSADQLHALLERGPLHVRPLAQDKVFNAGLFDGASWRAVMTSRRLDPELACWASAPQSIRREWRCWVVGHEVVGASGYARAGNLELTAGAPPEVVSFAQTIATRWIPAPCVVLDVAQTDAGLKLLEFNPIHCAGWYAVDVPHVLRAWLAWSCRHFAGARFCG